MIGDEKMEQKELFNKYSNIIQKSVSSKKEHHYLILLDDYIKLEKENEQLRLILGNQVRIKEYLLEPQLIKIIYCLKGKY